MTAAVPPSLPPTNLPAEPELVALLNANRCAFVASLGLVFTSANAERVCCELEVGPHLVQPYGLVHGGVYASVVETVASTGAAIDALPTGRNVVGLENTTSFVKAVRAGKLTAVGVPVHRGRATQLWQVDLRDERGELAASGRLRVLCLEPGASLAGQRVRLQSEQTPVGADAPEGETVPPAVDR